LLLLLLLHSTSWQLLLQCLRSMQQHVNAILYIITAAVAAKDLGLCKAQPVGNDKINQTDTKVAELMVVMTDVAAPRQDGPSATKASNSFVFYA
jgi:hypothetical protein